MRTRPGSLRRHGPLAAVVVLLALAGTPASVAARPPTNAAKVFGWGKAAWHDEFRARLDPGTWTISSTDAVRNQHGMLTLDAGQDAVTASAPGLAHTKGRWEARIRSRSYGRTGARFQVVMRLVPRGDTTCGQQDVVAATYPVGHNRVRTFLRNRDLQFRYGVPLTVNDQSFHSYAVEITATRISWFVDTHVVMTETRPPARTGLPYTVEFDLVPAPGTPAGTVMRPARMQMDRVRYYTLRRPDKLPVTAPAAHLEPDTVTC